MSLDMYNFIIENMENFNVDLEKGLIITPKGTNGTVCTSTGYLKFKHKGRSLQVHQVLAVFYFGEKCIGMQINHINGNKLVNTKYNLEPLTIQENIKHQFENGLDNVKRRKVNRFTMNGEYIDTFNSLKEAGESVNTTSNEICRALRGYIIKNGKKQNVLSVKGFKWRYADL